MAVILFAVFIDLVGFGLIVPILPFLTLKYGGDPLIGTALVAIYSLAAFICGPLWGRLSDRLGRRPTLIMTFMGAALSYTTLAFADSLALLFLARAMSGAMAGNVGIVMAALSDMTDADNRGRVLGYMGAAFGLGFAIGPGLGGVLATLTDETSIMLPGLVAASLSFTAMLLCLFFMAETRDKPDASQEDTPLPHWSAVLKGKAIPALLSMFVFVAVAQSIHFSITPFWLEAVMGWDERQVGFLLMSIGLIVAAVQSFAIGPLFRWVGEVKSMVLGSGLSVVAALMLVAYPGDLLVTFGCFPLLMAGMTISFPALNSLISRMTDTRLQGTALGLSSGLSALGRVVGPLTAGALFSSATPGIPYLIIASIGVILCLWFAFFAKQP